MVWEVVPLTGDCKHLELHRHSCSAGPRDCSGCNLANNYKKWRRHLEGIPWLAYRVQEDGVLGVGCALCAHEGHQSPLAIFEISSRKLALHKLQRHAATSQHQQAWKAASEKTGIPCPPSVDNDLPAPPTHVFQKALQSRLQGVACKKGLAECGIGPDKVRQLSFCLAEAKRMMLREWFLNSAETVAIQQDERRQKLLVRFTSASTMLEVRSGVLGLASNFGSCAGYISEATENVIRSFCSPGALAPGQVGRNAAVDDDLLLALTSKIEVCVADAASDEQKAQALMRSSRDGQAAFLPRVRLGIRDCAHATRRFRCFRK